VLPLGCGQQDVEAPAGHTEQGQLVHGVSVITGRQLPRMQMLSKRQTFEQPPHAIGLVDVSTHDPEQFWRFGPVHASEDMQTPRTQTIGAMQRRPGTPQFSWSDCRSTQVVPSAVRPGRQTQAPD